MLGEGKFYKLVNVFIIMVKKKVLLLGATGRIGPGFLEEYSKNYNKYYDIILGVHSKKNKGKFKSVKVDISHIKSLKHAMKGISVVVDLAANSNVNAKFEDLIEPNIVFHFLLALLNLWPPNWFLIAEIKSPQTVPFLEDFLILIASSSIFILDNFVSFFISSSVSPLGTSHEILSK